MAIRRKTKVSAEFSMSSMTDIVFLLLIFFLVTSTLVNPNALKLLLPKSTNQIQDKQQVSVSIKHHLENNTFTYHINGNVTPVSWGEIEDLLQSMLDNEEEPSFSIYSDKSVPVEEVVNLMNIAKRNKYKVVLATSPE